MHKVDFYEFKKAFSNCNLTEEEWSKFWKTSAAAYERDYCFCQELTNSIVDFLIDDDLCYKLKMAGEKPVLNAIVRMLIDILNLPGVHITVPLHTQPMTNKLCYCHTAIKVENAQ